MNAPRQCYAIVNERWRDGSPRFGVVMYREEIGLKSVGVDVPARRYEFDVLARDVGEAIKTVEYHFGLSALWYRVDETPRPVTPARACPCGEMTINDCAGECGRPAAIVDDLLRSLR